MSLSKLNKIAADASLVAVKSIEGAMKRRIFNEGGAVNGRIGKYRSRSYRAKRVMRGRQVAKKDLELDGDLRRSVQSGKRKGGAVVGFTNDKARLIAGYQEDQTGKLIFGATDDEMKDALSAFIKHYRNAITSR